MKQTIILIFLSVLMFQTEAKNKPTVYIIGDSTVKNGKGDGSNGLWGWGEPISSYFDSKKINVENDALGGTSSRTFQTKGLWEAVRIKLQPGDFVLMQFGHNDGGPVNDTLRARGTIKGIGEEIEEIDNLITKQHEMVHTYGWYLRKMVDETMERGAVAIVISPIPRNIWNDGKVQRASDNYGKWASEIAEKTDAFFIDLNELVAAKYESLGQEKVKAFFPGDHTHTSLEGAKLNAETVVRTIRELKNCELKKYLKKIK
ncbi:MAG: rhamnogalacturonan acetylesterase [Prolixibacteraceae bacterium]